MPEKIKSVGVVGTGVIGASWTTLFLAQGLKVLVSDPGPGAEEKLKHYLDEAWPKSKELGLAAGASLDNYRFVGASLEKYYGEVGFIQENAPEKLELKTKLIGEIDAGAREDVIIASSSSGLPSSTFVGQCKKNPGRVLIGHPFNPPHLMPLVEVVPHPGTSQEIVDATVSFYASLGKRPVALKHESPGFAANRLQAALNHEAYSQVARGLLSASDVDAVMTASLGPRWALAGPFMSGVAGGGGGKGGFKHLLEHLGPASEAWLKDMGDHEYQYTAENLDKLDASVQQEMGHIDLPTFEKERDGLLIRLLNDQKQSTMIAK